MKKIKTAAEIAMEKTRHLTAEGKDRRDEYREYIKAAEVLASSLLQNKTDPEKAGEAFARYPEPARELALKVFYGKIAAGISFRNAPAVIEFLRQNSGDESVRKSCDDLRKLYDSYRRKVEEKVQEAEKDSAQIMQQRLAREGIRGSAVYRINPAESDLRKEVSSRLEEDFDKQLSGFCSFLAGKSRPEDEV